MWNLVELASECMHGPDTGSQWSKFWPTPPLKHHRVFYRLVDALPIQKITVITFLLIFHSFPITASLIKLIILYNLIIFNLNNRNCCHHAFPEKSKMLNNVILSLFSSVKFLHANTFCDKMSLVDQPCWWEDEVKLKLPALFPLIRTENIK